MMTANEMGRLYEANIVDGKEPEIVRMNHADYDSLYQEFRAMRSNDPRCTHIENFCRAKIVIDQAAATPQFGFRNPVE